MTLTQQELSIITDAMMKASKATLMVREAGIKDASWSKEDKTPVTIADLASQAILLHEVANIRPADHVHAEEESDSIDDAKAQQVRDIVEEATGGSVSLGELRDRIMFRGDGTSGADWFIDPIDGTKGYVAGLFYAVACGRAIDGKLSEGWMGVPSGDARMEKITGKLFMARDGQGVKRWNIADGAEETFSVDPAPTLEEGGRLSVIGSRAHDKVDTPAGVDTDKWHVELLPMDSMAKYAALACGAAELYSRNPSPKFGAQYYWDHAAGVLLVQEAGGLVTDLEGKPIDWTCGDRMTANEGIFATRSPELHAHFQPIFEKHGMKK
jgi:3'(2'), 5'-bisphosphate nucleotidase